MVPKIDHSLDPWQPGPDNKLLALGKSVLERAVVKDPAKILGEFLRPGGKQPVVVDADRFVFKVHGFPWADEVFLAGVSGGFAQEQLSETPQKYETRRMPKESVLSPICLPQSLKHLLLAGPEKTPPWLWRQAESAPCSHRIPSMKLLACLYPLDLHLSPVAPGP